MAMTAASLSSRIVSELNAQQGAPEDATKRQEFADAIAKAIFDEITLNAVVTSNGATLVGTPGGPLTITGLPGVIT